MATKSFNVPSYKRVKKIQSFYMDLLDSLQFCKMHKRGLVYLP